MSSKQKYIFRYFLLLLSGYLMLVPNHAIADSKSKILACIENTKNRKYKFCVIKTRQGQRGTVVNLYNKRQFWVASGVIIRKKKEYIIARVESGNRPILTNYKARIGHQMSWKNSFSAYDGW